MKKVKKDMKVDEYYFVKFGKLKQAAVLMYYGRENEAFDTLANAAKIVQEQRQHQALPY